MRFFGSDVGQYIQLSIDGLHSHRPQTPADLDVTGPRDTAETMVSDGQSSTNRTQLAGRSVKGGALQVRVQEGGAGALMSISSHRRKTSRVWSELEVRLGRE